MSKQKLQNIYGYTLFELIVVMIVISILMTASMRFMGNTVDVSKTEETKDELHQLAIGIVGDEQNISGNHRIDYGYVGDIGALPVNLNNLVTNPGLATWDGPYLHDDFYASATSAETEYAIDGWGKQYTYAGDVTISSTGGSTTITRELATNSDVLLYNKVSLNIVDLDYCPPGTTDKDSVVVELTYPNGLGGYQSDSKNPYADGFVQFDSIPIGQQTLSVIELKNNDTLYRKIHINPNTLYHADVQFPTSIWCSTVSGSGGSTIEYVSATAQTLTGQCNRVDFDIINNSGAIVNISDITIQVTDTTVYYQKITFGTSVVINHTNPKLATGTIDTFGSTQTIANGETVSMRLETFYDSASGGNQANMSNREFTITFSDGSVITFIAGPC